MTRCRSTARRAHIRGRWIIHSTPRRPADPAHEQGSAAVELVLLAPVLMVLLLFVVYLGRLTQANAKVHHAADQAARAASMVSRVRSSSVASATALGELGADGVMCAGLTVTSRRASAAGLSSIEVTVQCTVEADDLAPLVPGRRTITATSSEVIDVIRAIDE